MSRLRSSGRLAPGSPLLALQVPDPFDKYIFCEQDNVKMLALKQRVERIAPHADVSFVSGDVNSRVDIVESHIPKGKGVLSFASSIRTRCGSGSTLWSVLRPIGPWTS